jgi:hypothetical protein
MDRCIAISEMLMARLQVVGEKSGRLHDTKTGARELAPWLVRLARVGYAAKGVVYLVIGALATLAAAGNGGGTTDARGALALIGHGASGRGVLGVLGAGLLGYTIWAIIAAVTDADRRGRDTKGMALRIAQAGRGLMYGGLGLEALRLMATARRSNGGGTRHWTGVLMDAPFGRWLVAALGASVAAYALYQFWRAARKDLRKRLHLSEAGETAARWVLRLARFGIAARGVVFLVIGWFLVRAAWTHDPGRAGGIADSLVTLSTQPYGPILLAVVALGLMAYGLWELANARYRDMHVE